MLHRQLRMSVTCNLTIPCTRTPCLTQFSERASTESLNLGSTALSGSWDHFQSLRMFVPIHFLSPSHGPRAQAKPTDCAPQPIKHKWSDPKIGPSQADTTEDTLFHTETHKWRERKPAKKRETLNSCRRVLSLTDRMRPKMLRRTLKILVHTQHTRKKKLQPSKIAQKWAPGKDHSE